MFENNYIVSELNCMLKFFVNFGNKKSRTGVCFNITIIVLKKKHKIRNKLNFKGCYFIEYFVSNPESFK